MPIDIVEWLSGALWWLIGGWGLLSLLLLLGVAVLSRRVASQLKDRLYNLVRVLVAPWQPDRDSSRHQLDEIAVLLQSLREVFASPRRVHDIKYLEQWIADRDADKLEMKRHRFERWYSFARAQIEVLPLAGICGTLGRMAYALQQSSKSGQISDDFLLQLTTHFANSLASTLAALVFTIVLIWVNALFEPGFDRLIEQRGEYRDIVATARRTLADSAGSQA